MGSMKSLLRSSSALVVGMLFTAVTASAAETLKFAHVYETSEPYHKWALWAANEVSKRTEGRYEMKVFSASSLGTESEINEALGLGSIDVIYTSPLFSSLAYGPIAISDAPYMFRDLDHWRTYAQSDLFGELSDGYFEATGNKVLALGYYGQRHVTSNRPIREPSDMEGLKIRVPNAPLFLLFPEAVGANPTPLAFAEVYLALQQGVVDAQENPLPTIQAKKFYEVQSQINLTGHITNGILAVAGGPFWSRLSDQDRAIFAAIFQEAADHCTDEVATLEKSLVDWFRSQGVTVNEVDRTAFREAVVPLLNGDRATWSEEQFDQLQALGH